MVDKEASRSVGVSLCVEGGEGGGGGDGGGGGGGGSGKASWRVKSWCIGTSEIATWYEGSPEKNLGRPLRCGALNRIGMLFLEIADMQDVLLNLKFLFT